jgi:hypothetical protein
MGSFHDSLNAHRNHEPTPRPLPGGELRWVQLMQFAGSPPGKGAGAGWSMGSLAGALPRMDPISTLPRSLRIEPPFEPGVKFVKAVVFADDRPILGQLVFDGISLLAFLRDILARANRQSLRPSLSAAEFG